MCMCVYLSKIVRFGQLQDSATIHTLGEVQDVVHNNGRLAHAMSAVVPDVSAAHAAAAKGGGCGSPGKAATWISRNRVHVAFWLLGVLNNASFVIMIAAATSISSGGVGLVYMADIMPGVLVKVRFTPASAAQTIDRAPLRRGPHRTGSTAFPTPPAPSPAEF